MRVVFFPCRNGAQNPSAIIEITSKIIVKSIKIPPWSPKSIENSSKSIKNHGRDPFGAQGAPRAAPGPPPLEKVMAIVDFLDDPGCSKGRFWSPRGSQKGSKIDLVCIGRHPGVPRRLKKTLQRGVRKGSQKVIENGSKKVRFWEAKNHLK